VTGSWQRSRNTCRPNETTKNLAIATAHPLVQRLLAARSALRCAHERAALDGCDAMTPTTPPIHPPPERSTDGPWLGPDDNYPDDNYPDDNYPDDNYCRSTSPITNVAATSSTTTTTPNPGAAPTAPGPTTPATAHPLTKEDPRRTQEDQNHIQRTEVDGEM